MSIASARCSECGAELTAHRAKPEPAARYCSNACRQRAYRRRRARRTAAGAEPTTAGNLPASLDSFVGREAEIAELHRLVGHHRLVTLVGPPGSGKSRLAVEFAARLRASFADGAWLVQLGAVDGDDIAGMVASVLGAGGSGGDNLLAATRGKQMVLVLDDCEHLRDQCASLVTALLADNARLRVLATSREALRLLDEAVLSVGALPLPAGPDIEAVAQSDAVRLFVDRARAGCPEFELNEENAASLARLCAHLDGMPLAIELAGSRVRQLPIDRILTHLEDRFSLLTVGSHASAGRHRGLASAIAWSHRMLDHRERAVFRRLTALAAQFDIDAATAVCASDDLSPATMPQVLASLTAKSLLVPVAPVGTGPRFRMLESLRAYGERQLRAAGEAAATHARLVAWLTEAAAPLVTAADPPARVRAHLDHHRDHLLRAVEWTTCHHDDAHALLTAALASCWRDRGQAVAAHRRVMLALNLIGASSHYRPLLLTGAATLTMWRHDQDGARQLAEQAVDAARKRRQHAVLVNALTILGHVHQERGDLPAARRCYLDALRVAEELGQPAAVTKSQHHLALIESRRGDLESATDLIERTLAARREEPGSPALPAVLHSAGEIALIRGDVDGAERRFVESLRCLSNESGSVTYPMDGLAVVAVARGDATRGLWLATASALIRSRTAAPRDPTWSKRVDDAVAAAGARLGTAAVSRVTAAVHQLDQEQMIAQALDEHWSTADGHPTAEEIIAGRDRLIVELLALGLTNGQIARRLGVSARTVAADLTRIRTLLHVRSRTEVAAWATRRSSPASRIDASSQDAGRPVGTMDSTPIVGIDVEVHN